VENGRLDDLLRLAVKGPAAMSGAIGFRAKVVVPPGQQDIAERVKLDGEFGADSAVFHKLDVQQKVNKLSHGGKAQPEESPADTLGSDFSGRFRIANGVAELPFRRRDRPATGARHRAFCPRRIPRPRSRGPGSVHGVD
jgi:hypothetical protein